MNVTIEKMLSVTRLHLGAIRAASKRYESIYSLETSLSLKKSR